MVKLHVKKGDESFFLFETTVNVFVQDLVLPLVKLYNGLLKVQRLCQGTNLAPAGMCTCSQLVVGAAYYSVSVACTPGVLLRLHHIILHGWLPSQSASCKGTCIVRTHFYCAT